MKAAVPATIYVLLLLSFLAACGPNGPAVPLETSHIGAWARTEASPGDGSRVYARLESGAPAASFELFANGRLFIKHAAYVGGDFPTTFPCDGTWYEEAEGVLVASYAYGNELISYRITVLRVDAFELCCQWSRIR